MTPATGANLSEGNIKLKPEQGCIKSYKFDVAEYFKYSHCAMKAVDFIVETGDKIYFIEIKQPQSQNTTDGEKYFDEKVIDIARKYRDSFLYEWSKRKGGMEKELFYLVIIENSRFQGAQYLRFQDRLKNLLPIDNVPPDCKRFVHKCVVCNCDFWNNNGADFRFQILP